MFIWDTPSVRWIRMGATEKGKGGGLGGNRER